MGDKLRIAYCEDEEIQLKYMHKLLEAFEAKHNIEIEFYGYQSAKEFLFEQEDGYPFSAIFLDIDMQKMNGMELAKEIRTKDIQIPIIFLTNRKEYVFEGYEVRAYLYLLKPLDEIKLEHLLLELYKEQTCKKQYIIEKQDRQTIKIDIAKICYFEVSGHYLNVYCIDGTYTIKKSLQDIIGELKQEKKEFEESGFLLTHRSFLVNLEYVDKITRTECVLSNHKQVPISRNEYKNVNQAFMKYYLAKK